MRLMKTAKYKRLRKAAVRAGAGYFPRIAPESWKDSYLRSAADVGHPRNPSMRAWSLPTLAPQRTRREGGAPGLAGESNGTGIPRCYAWSGVTRLRRCPPLALVVQDDPPKDEGNGKGQSQKSHPSQKRARMGTPRGSMPPAGGKQNRSLAEELEAAREI
jgi:hypothetical protein